MFEYCRGHGCLSLVIVVRYMSLRGAHHLSRGILPSVVCLIVISKPQQRGGLDPLRLSSHEKDLKQYYISLRQRKNLRPINNFRISNEKKTKNDKILKKEHNFILNRIYLIHRPLTHKSRATSQAADHSHCPTAQVYHQTLLFLCGVQRHGSLLSSPTRDTFL